MKLPCLLWLSLLTVGYSEASTDSLLHDAILRTTSHSLEPSLRDASLSILHTFGRQLQVARQVIYTVVLSVTSPNCQATQEQPIRFTATCNDGGLLVNPTISSDFGTGGLNCQTRGLDTVVCQQATFPPDANDSIAASLLVFSCIGVQESQYTANVVLQPTSYRCQPTPTDTFSVIQSVDLQTFDPIQQVVLHNADCTGDTVVAVESSCGGFQQCNTPNCVVSFESMGAVERTPISPQVVTVLGTTATEPPAMADVVPTMAPVAVASPVPPNDQCLDAMTLTGRQTGTTAGASADQTPSCSGITSTSPAVWYQVIGTGRRVTVTTVDARTDFDTILSVFTGSCATLVCVDANDDDALLGTSLSSTVTWDTIRGQTYYILVHGFMDTGPFGISITEAPASAPSPRPAPVAPAAPSNDECRTAASILERRMGNTQGAAVQNFPACNGVPHNSRGVWYRLEGGANQEITATTCDAATQFDTQLSVFSGSCTDGLVCVDADTGGCASVTWRAEAESYWLLVHGADETQAGAFGLNVSRRIVPMGNPTLAPVTSTMAPPIVGTTNAPVASTSAPVVNTNAPIASTRAPVAMTATNPTASPTNANVATSRPTPVLRSIPAVPTNSNSSASSPSSGLPIGIIVGAAMGVLVPIVAVLCWFCCCRRKKSLQKDVAPAAEEEYADDTTTNYSVANSPPRTIPTRPTQRLPSSHSSNTESRGTIEEPEFRSEKTSVGSVSRDWFDERDPRYHEARLQPMSSGAIEEKEPRYLEAHPRHQVPVKVSSSQYNKPVNQVLVPRDQARSTIPTNSTLTVGSTPSTTSTPGSGNAAVHDPASSGGPLPSFKNQCMTVVAARSPNNQGPRDPSFILDGQASQRKVRPRDRSDPPEDPPVGFNEEEYTY